MKNAYLEFRSFAEGIARESGEVTLQYFRTDVKVEEKKDRSPVTEADRLGEELLRERIRKKFPDHGIIGEEFGRERADAEFVWTLDPIDGTKSFINGIPLFTVLIALLHRGESVVGIIHAPALDELCSASQGGGVTQNGDPVISADSGRPLALLTDPAAFMKRYPKALAAYFQEFPFQRSWGDAYGYLMVATGRAQIMIDPVLSIWDAAPLKPVIEESGGVFSDLYGKKTLEGTGAVGASAGAYRIYNEKIKAFIS